MFIRIIIKKNFHRIVLIINIFLSTTLINGSEPDHISPPYPFIQRRRALSELSLSEDRQTDTPLPQPDPVVEDINVATETITTLVEQIGIEPQSNITAPQANSHARRKKILPSIPLPQEPTVFFDRKLLKAVADDDSEEVKKLLSPAHKGEKAANPNTLFGGQNALHQAVFNNNERIVKILCEYKKTNPNIQNLHGNTPLHYATTENITYLLIKKGADPTIINNCGNNPQECALLSGRCSLAMIMQTALEKEKRAEAIRLFAEREKQKKAIAPMSTEEAEEIAECLTCCNELPKNEDTRFKPFMCGHSVMCEICFKKSYEYTKCCSICREKELTNKSTIPLQAAASSIQENNEENYQEFLALTLNVFGDEAEERWV